jgi:hypothetical protein
MSNKLALCALLLVAFVFSASVSVDAQRKKVNGAISVFEPAPTEVLEPEANPAADIDQCHNGGVGAAVEPCVGAQWVNGNANGNQAHYREGDYIHYRLKFTNLVVGDSYTVKLGYDIFDNGGKHAIDYLGTYNKDARFAQPTPGIADYAIEPCLEGANCAALITSTIAIPADDVTVTPFITQESGVFTMWGGTLTGTSAYGLENTVIRTISVTFTAGATNPVLAWGGHIAWQGDWGANGTAATAGDINGSPYHMRIVSNGVFNGEQNRQLSVSAIIGTTPTAAPASITGRVRDAYGRGISYARVQLFDALTGEARTAYSNSFGYYRFDEVTVGNLYVMSVAHKRYLFLDGSTSFTLEADLAGMDFVASN